MNDEYKGLKDNYFENAQQMTGSVGSVIKAMNSYVREYDHAKKVMTDAVEELNKNFLPNTAMYNTKKAEIFEVFNASVKECKEKYASEIQKVTKQVKDKVNKAISKPLPDGAMDDLAMIRSLAGTMTGTELQVFIDKYDKNYFVKKAILEAIGKDTARELGIKFVNGSDILESVASIESTASDFIRNYDGKLLYEGARLLHGTGMETIDGTIDSFVSAYED